MDNPRTRLGQKRGFVGTIPPMTTSRPATLSYKTPQAKAFDHQLNERRKELGLSFPELAARIGLSQQGLRNVRQGTTEPREATVEGIETALGWARGGYAIAQTGKTPPLRTAPEGSNTPVMPPGKGFRWSVRPNKIIDYWYTLKIGDKEITLHVPDVENLGKETIRAELEKSVIALKIAHTM